MAIVLLPERKYGRRWCSRVGGIDIIVITNNGQAVDLGQFTSLGIDPTRYRTVAVKSMQHFRAAFEPIARAVVGVDTGALCSEIYAPRALHPSPPPGLTPGRPVLIRGSNLDYLAMIAIYASLHGRGRMERCCAS